MKPKMITCLAFLLLTVSFQQAHGMATPPIELSSTNLRSDYPFIVIKSGHIPKLGNEMDFFTAIVMPGNGHKPENFEGWLEICDKEKRICMTQVVPRKRKTKGIAFEFEVSTGYLATSGFSLVEPLHELEDNPKTYRFCLKDFSDAAIDEKETSAKQGQNSQSNVGLPKQTTTESSKGMTVSLTMSKTNRMSLPVPLHLTIENQRQSLIGATPWNVEIRDSSGQKVVETELGESRFSRLRPLPKGSPPAKIAEWERGPKMKVRLLPGQKSTENLNLADLFKLKPDEYHLEASIEVRMQGDEETVLRLENVPFEIVK